MRNQLAFLFLMLPFLSMAQEDSTEVFDYSKFGDAQGVKRYCNQKVLNQTPQRIISLGMERMGGFDIPALPVSAMLPAMQDFTASHMTAIKAQVNIPVISTNKLIWQLGANYWGSRIAIAAPGTNLIAKQLATHTLTSTGINTTIFKPLNEKNFLIIQASADLNGIFHELKDINSKSLTISGTAIYGWKLSEKIWSEPVWLVRTAPDRSCTCLLYCGTRPLTTIGEWSYSCPLADIFVIISLQRVLCNWALNWRVINFG